MLARLGLRLRIFLLFAGLAGGSMGALLLAVLVAISRADESSAMDIAVQILVIGGFLILGLIAAIWYLFDLNVAKPIESLSGLLRARAHAEVGGEIDASLARYLGDLAPAASATARSLAETRGALVEAVARETTRLAAEKARLEALLADVPVGVVLCSAEHRLAFYNGQSVELLGAGGLDRDLFDALRPGPIRHAYDRLIDANDPDAVSDILCTTVAGGRVLAGRMRLLAPAQASGNTGPSERPGYVLTLRDVTADMAETARREALLAEMIDRVRRRAAALETLLAARNVAEDPAQKAGRIGQIDAALVREAEALSRTAQEAAERSEALHADALPLIMTRASDLIDGLAALLGDRGISVETEAQSLLVGCNGFEIIALMSGLLARVSAESGVSRMTLSIDEDGPGALIRAVWHGSPLPVGRLDAWLAEPNDSESEGRTGRSVLATHGTEIWPEHGPDDRVALCLPIPKARRAGRRPKPVQRSVVFDFELLSRERSASVAAARLETLSYVVFDTETTGLLPEQGDEIVQIAAVRIVNGRRVESEVLDLLVNPGRPIPTGSIEVHGITDAMVAEAPDVVEACRRFHAFARGSVLIAHNAPFDMTFLRRREAALGLQFDHPILDTVLLSAVVFGQHETHSLDALTHRLGISIPEEARHTAIGDALATAEAFIKLLPMLRGRRLETFGDVLGEVRRHGRLLKDLN
jgi:DNA polymerase-3 subunit epsilon